MDTNQLKEGDWVRVLPEYDELSEDGVQTVGQIYCLMNPSQPSHPEQMYRVKTNIRGNRSDKQLYFNYYEYEIEKLPDEEAMWQILKN